MSFGFEYRPPHGREVLRDAARVLVVAIGTAAVLGAAALGASSISKAALVHSDNVVKYGAGTSSEIQCTRPGPNSFRVTGMCHRPMGG
jgi:hypothetical protein